MAYRKHRNPIVKTVIPAYAVPVSVPRAHAPEGGGAGRLEGRQPCGEVGKTKGIFMGPDGDNGRHAWAHRRTPGRKRARTQQAAGLQTLPPGLENMASGCRRLQASIHVRFSPHQRGTMGHPGKVPPVQCPTWTPGRSRSAAAPGNFAGHLGAVATSARLCAYAWGGVYGSGAYGPPPPP